MLANLIVGKTIDVIITLRSHTVPLPWVKNHKQI